MSVYVNVIVSWKPFTFLDSFRNKSGKPQPIRTKVGTHAQVKGRQCSRNFGRDRLSGGQNGGSKVSPTPKFFVSNTIWLFGNFATADFRQIWPRHVNRIGTQILDRNLRKLSIQGSFASKTPNLEQVKQAPHSEQATGQGMHCREILFTPLCSARPREFPRSGQFLPRDAMHKRVLCRHAVSVCLSVTFVSYVKTNKDIFEFFSPSGSQAILVFSTPNGMAIFRRKPPLAGAPNARRYEKFTIFDQYLAITQKGCQIEP